MSDPDQFLGGELDEATNESHVRRAYALAIAMDPLASPTDLSQLMSMRDTRLREISEGVVRRPHVHDPAATERFRWRNACADGQTEATSIEAWFESLTFDDARSSHPYRQMMTAYPEWIEWRQSADAPVRSVRIIEQWLRYGADADALAAFRAEPALMEPTRRSLRIRPHLYSLVGPLLFQKFGTRPSRPSQAARGEPALDRPVLETESAPVVAEQRVPPARRSKGGIVILILFFSWVLATAIWFFSDDEETSDVQPEAPAREEAPR